MQISDADVGALTRSRGDRTPILRWGGIISLGAYTWAGQIKQVSPFNGLPIDFTMASSALTLFFALALAFRWRSFRMTKNAGKAWLMLFVIGLSGSVFRLSTLYAVEKELSLYQLTLPIALATAIIISTREDFIGLVIASSGWAVFLSLSVLVNGVQDATGRLNASTGATISFSRAASMVLIAALAWALTERSRKLIWLMPIALAICALQLYVVISIGSRGPAQAIMMATFMMLVLQATKLELKVGFRMFAVLAVAGIGLAVLWSRTPEFSRRRILGIFTGEENARSGGGRDQFYIWTFENLPYTPAGNGWGSWEDQSVFFGYLYPHNIVLEIWYEAGIVGFAAFTTLIIWATLNQFKRMKTDRFVATLGMGVLYSWLGAAMVSGDFNDNRSLYVFIMAIAAVPIRSGLDHVGGGDRSERARSYSDVLTSGRT